MPKYKGLPEGVAYPQQLEQPAVFPSVTGKKSTTMGALATFLSGLMKLKFTALKATSADIKQINATNSYTRDEQGILKDSKVQTALKGYSDLIVCETFEVTSVLTTKTLGVSFSKTIGGSIQVNGTELPDCKPIADDKKTADAGDKKDTTSKPAANTKDAKSTSTAPSGNKASVNAAISLPKLGTTIEISNKENADKAESNSGIKSGTGSGAKGVSSSIGPAYGVYGCLANLNQITLATESPVAIAIQVNRIQFKNGHYVAEPVPTDPKTLKWKNTVADQPAVRDPVV